jgi:hypothetical protein
MHLKVACRPRRPRGRLDVQIHMAVATALMVVESWTNADDLGLMQQLGAVLQERNRRLPSPTLRSCKPPVENLRRSGHQSAPLGLFVTKSVTKQTKRPRIRGLFHWSGRPGSNRRPSPWQEGSSILSDAAVYHSVSQGPERSGPRCFARYRRVASHDQQFSREW